MLKEIAPLALLVFAGVLARAPQPEGRTARAVAAVGAGWSHVRSSLAA